MPRPLPFPGAQHLTTVQADDLVACLIEGFKISVVDRLHDKVGVHKRHHIVRQRHNGLESPQLRQVVLVCDQFLLQFCGALPDAHAQQPIPHNHHKDHHAQSRQRPDNNLQIVKVAFQRYNPAAQQFPTPLRTDAAKAGVQNRRQLRPVVADGKAKLKRIPRIAGNL